MEDELPLLKPGTIEFLLGTRVSLKDFPDVLIPL
jgi:hypothetical protein